jgi:hypothetical protein
VPVESGNEPPIVTVVLPALPSDPDNVTDPDMSGSGVTSIVLPPGPYIVKLVGTETETLCPPSPVTPTTADVTVEPGRGETPSPLVTTLVAPGARVTSPGPARGREIIPNDMAWVAPATSVRKTEALIGSDVERAYRRGDALEQRRHLMGDWTTYLSSGAV